jgi:riboflavin transporter FmnP
MARSKEIASIAIFGALSAVITTITNLPIFRFPPLPFLRFDMGEIIDFLAFLILGPISALFVVLVHFLTISAFPGAQVQFASQAMKAAAILSTILGFLLITKIKREIFGIAGALVSRVVIMTFANYLFFLVFFPAYFDGSASMLSKFLGINLTDFWSKFTLLFIFLGIFNAIHALITTIIPLYILKVSPQLVRVASSIKPLWITRYLNFKK